MVDNLVSVRRYVKAMLAATARSECLGLVLLAGRPSDLDVDEKGTTTRSDLAGTLGPYVGLARPVPAGHEGGGVVFPDGTRVLADGLDAHCWPGSEAAFREELAAESPTGWTRRPRSRRHGGSEDVARRAATEIAWYMGVEWRALPAVAVLDPATRRGLVVSLPRGASVPSFAQRLVKELDGWPRRRLPVVEQLLAARLERADRDRGAAREVVRAHEWYARARGCDDEHERAVWFARCSDALRTSEPARFRWRLEPGPAVADEAPDDGTPDDGSPDDGPAHGATTNGATTNGATVGRADELADRRATRLDALITRLRGELDQCDRARCTADAAVRAARAELGELRSTMIFPPEALTGWRVDHLRGPGALRRFVPGRH